VAIVVALTDQTQLAARVAQQLNLPLALCPSTKFSDGEVHVALEDPSRFRGQTVVLVQSTCAPVSETTLLVPFLVHELKNAGASRVIGVIPYLGYSRQELSKATGKSGSGWVVAQMLERAGLDELFILELHEPALKDFFTIPVHDMLARDAIAQHIRSIISDLKSVCIVAPDEGAHSMATDIAKPLGASTMVFQKERYAPDKTRLIGSVGHKAASDGMIAIIVDDIIDTGGTAINVCDALKRQGFEKVFGYFVHPVLSGNACEKIEKSGFDTVFVSNSIPVRHTKNIDIVDMSALIAHHVSAVL
jgi:ribose-phosphate pyrophosphokinase